MNIIDLSGEWRYKTDYDDNGIAEEYFKSDFELGGFKLPGSTCENGVGKKQEYYNEFSNEALRAPREKYEYIAPLWLQREIVLPEEFENKYLRLFLERVNIASELWIDGEKVDRQIIELSAPHIYNLTGKLTAGKHILTLRIDNRNLINIDTVASGYSIDTQGYWNGVIGRVELQCEDKFHLENIQVYPVDNGINVKLTEVSDLYSPFERRNVKLEMFVTTPSGKRHKAKEFSHVLYNSRQVEYLSYEFDAAEYWSEFNPALYTLTVRYIHDGSCDEKSIKFGMRFIKVEKNRILLNGKPLSLRGTIDCAIYPLTGYPPTDTETWKKNFGIVKSYGLNHVRFHAWCPPDAAFTAADELGLYLSVEMPMWLNRAVCALELGDDGAHRTYFTQEATAISKTYGNHPSFVMFSNGNENMGDYELLDDITTQIKAYDKRRLYTCSSNFDHPVLPSEDYFCGYEAGGKPVRIQHMQDVVAQSTCVDFDDAVKDFKLPVVSFEIGQYCVYPDVNVIGKYTGNMLPTNFDAIKKEMIRKNVYHRLSDYIKASGDLAVKLYKEDIEAALRTKGLGGFELLSLCDYTGQLTATVGILDAFFDSKGITTPQRFKRFCNCVVPLFKAKRIFRSSETLNAELDLYDYGRQKIQDPVFDVKIYNGKEVFYGVKTRERKISVPLGGIKKSTKLKAEVKVDEYVNSWNIYVFTERKQYANVRIVKTVDELNEITEVGGRVIVTSDCVKSPRGGGFIPVFWSPVCFPAQKCGAIIDTAHPIFKSFPTDKYPDYQWKTLLDSAKSVDVSSLNAGFKPIVEIVPNFADSVPASPLFEAKIGNAQILYCGFDLNADDVVVRQLKACIYDYVASKEFNPVFIADKCVFTK